MEAEAAQVDDFAASDHPGRARRPREPHARRAAQAARARRRVDPRHRPRRPLRAALAAAGDYIMSPSPCPSPPARPPLGYARGDTSAHVGKPSHVATLHEACQNRAVMMCHGSILRGAAPPSRSSQWCAPSLPRGSSRWTRASASTATTTTSRSSSRRSCTPPTSARPPSPPRPTSTGRR